MIAEAGEVLCVLRKECRVCHAAIKLSEETSQTEFDK